jgi:rubrerythrin
MLCSKCSNQINPERLKVVPNTFLCTECKSKIEAELIVNSKREKRKDPIQKTNKIGNLRKLYKCNKCGYSLNMNPDLKCASCNEKSDFSISYS